MADAKAVVAGALGRTKGRPDADVASAVLADLASAGIEVVSELPRAQRVGGNIETGAVVATRQATAPRARELAAAWLAVARQLESETVLDPADVDALAEQLRSLDTGGGHQDLAAALLRGGKVKVQRA